LCWEAFGTSRPTKPSPRLPLAGGSSHLPGLSPHHGARLVLPRRPLAVPCPCSVLERSWPLQHGSATLCLGRSRFASAGGSASGFITCYPPCTGLAKWTFFVCIAALDTNLLLITSREARGFLGLEETITVISFGKFLPRCFWVLSKRKIVFVFLYP